MKISVPEPKEPLPLTTVQLGDENCKIEATGLFRGQDAADYIPNPESEQLRIDVPIFEGPLDLLLHLIKKHSMDIFDIPIVTITQKYLEAIESLEELNIDLAGEFLLMAATLLHIKSKMLLPKEEQPEEDDSEEGKDPRAELVKRLLEYQKFKEVADVLRGKSQLGQDVFLRTQMETELHPAQIDHFDEANTQLESVQIFELLGLFADIIEARKPHIAHTVRMEKISIRARITEVLEFCRDKKELEFVDFLKNFRAKSTYDVIVTFLAMLECARLKFLSIRQPNCTSPLILIVNEENLGEDLDSYAELGTEEEYA